MKTILNNPPTNSTLSDYYFFKKKGIYHKIFIKDILYFEADGDYLRVQLSGEKQYISQAKIGDLEKKFPLATFLRIHRSYLIQLSCIESVDFIKNELLIGGQWLPFSRTKRKEIKDFVIARTLE